MGYRGPIPKPSAIARAEGNPGKRRLNDCEPQPRATTPRRPDHLGALAKKEWRYLVPVLRRMKALSLKPMNSVGEPVPALVHVGESAGEADGNGHSVQSSIGICPAESVIFDGESVHRHGHETVPGVWPNSGRAIADRGAD
jgi:hypothetical protein